MISDQSILLGLQAAADSIVDQALSANEQEEDGSVETSSLPDTLEDDNANALATDEWKQIRAAASGDIVNREVTSENAYTGNVGIVSNGPATITNIYGSAAPSRRTYGSARMAEEWLDKNRRVYVEQPGYADALKMLGQRNIVILCCDQHTGKQAAALNLLTVKYPVQIHALHPQTDLDDALTFEPQYGYLIDSLQLTIAQKLSAFTLHRLASQLKSQQSYLAITVDSQSLVHQSGLDEYAILWNVVPERDLMLQKHLAWYLKDETLRPSARAYCDHAALKRVLAGLAPAQIDKLAKLLADIEFGKLTSVDQALAKFTADPSTQVADWFRSYTRLEERTFLIALAVFSGARYQSIIDADNTLQSIIADSPAATASSAFDSTRSGILHDSNARMIYNEEQARFGPVIVERVELDKPEQRVAMLDYIWKEYDGLRTPILNWLQQLGTSNVPDMRELTAGAVARFAQYDLAKVRGAVLRPWARHADNRVRRAAALALTLLATESRFSPYAFGLLTNWSQLRNSHRLCWTAAAAYGGLLEPHFLEEALRGLGNVAQAGEEALSDVVIRGVANLFQSAQQPPFCGRILDELVVWTNDPKQGKSTPVGLLTFANLARVADSGNTPGSSPALLALAAGPECSSQVRTLWRRALNHPVARAKAVTALRGWLDAVDGNPMPFSAVQGLIADLVAAGDAREQQRLDYWLDRWARDPKQPCPAAARIRSNTFSGTQAQEAHV